MRILQVSAQGLPLFSQPLHLAFYTRQRVDEDDRASLFQLASKPSVYLNPANAFIGINASGKTSVLKVLQLAFSIVSNEPINHTPAKSILGEADHAVFDICFCDAAQNICRLKTVVSSRKGKSGEPLYFIANEQLWVKPLAKVTSKKSLTDFSGMAPAAVREGNEAFLPDDVSFIIAHNKQTHDSLDVRSLLSFTNVNVLPFSETIPSEIIAYLDPTVEKLCFERCEKGALIHLKFRGENEIILRSTAELEHYLSSGTIKGIVTFSMVKEILQSGGYLLADEIENHFNKEIVSNLIRFFMDSSLNKNGGTLIFTTHYPELLDIYDRNDGIHIVRNQGGITAENLAEALKRNDIKKSEAYQSDILKGTAPTYNAYLQLKKSLVPTAGRGSK